MATREDVDKLIPASRTDINIDKGLYTGNLGLSDDYTIVKPFADFILVEYIDVKSEMIETADGLYIPQTVKEMQWRKGKILQVGPYVQFVKPGDIVTFPNDKGLATSKVHYTDSSGNIQVCENGIFLNEQRLFAQLEPIGKK